MRMIAKPVAILGLLLLAAFATESALAAGGRGRSGSGHFSGGAAAHSGGSARFSGAPRGHFGGGRHFGPRVGVGFVLAAPFFWPGYYYPAPYYDPYFYPPLVAAPYAPPTEYIEQGVTPAAPPQSQAMWYYCAEPEGYYPYVQQCPGGWQVVSPTPASPPR